MTSLANANFFQFSGLQSFPMRSCLVLLLQLAGVMAFAQPSSHDVSHDTITFQKDLYIKPASVAPSKMGGWQRAIKAPAALTVLSLYSFTDNENLDKWEVKELRDEVAPVFRHHADDYLQYAPIAATYGLNLAGIKGKSDIANRTALIIKSGLLVAAITLPLKKLTAVPRPDTGERNSFPSGHTATAFAAATFMAKEYAHVNRWYGIGAYTVATGVGVMRILNNRHWVTDTLAGAAIGILSTNVVYLTHRYKWGHRKRNCQTLVIPSYDGQTGIVHVVHVLH